MHDPADLKLGRAPGGDPRFDQGAKDACSVQVVGSCPASEFGKKIVSVVWVTTHMLIYAIAGAIVIGSK